MAAASSEELTLEQLIDANPAFSKWVMSYLNSGPKDKMRIAKEGNSYRVFLTRSEEKRMNAYLLNGGKPPEWVQKCHKLQTHAVVVADVETVMCILCGGLQRVCTQCPFSGDYHL
jgi:hypothetical protein